MSWAEVKLSVEFVNTKGQVCNLRTCGSYCCSPLAIFYGEAEEEEIVIELAKWKQLSITLVMCWHLYKAARQLFIIPCTFTLLYMQCSSIVLMLTSLSWSSLWQLLSNLFSDYNTVYVAVVAVVTVVNNDDVFAWNKFIWQLFCLSHCEWLRSFVFSFYFATWCSCCVCVYVVARV